MSESYVQSGSIEVFPAGFRSQQYITGKAFSEKALISLRSFSNFSANQTFFVEDPASSSNAIIGIWGYNFYLAKSSIPTSTTNLYAFIRLRQVNTTIGYVLDNIERDLSGTLTSGSNYVLDEQETVGSTTFYEFHGLQFTTTQPSASETIKYIQVRDSTGAFSFTNLRLNASEVRDDGTGSTGTKSITEEFHTAAATIGTLVTTTYNPTSITVGTTTDGVLTVNGYALIKNLKTLTDSSTYGGRALTDIFENDSATVKTATAANNVNKTGSGLLVQESDSTVLKTGTGFIKQADGAISYQSKILNTDVNDDTFDIAKTNGLQDALDAKLAKSGGSASSLSVSGLTTTDAATINGTLLGGSSVVGTTLPSSGTTGQIFFLVQNQ